MSRPSSKSVGGWQVIALSAGLIISGSACTSSVPTGSTENSGASGGPAVTSAVASKGPGDYRFEYKGATGVVSIPADAANPAVAKLEAYRKKAGAPTVTYFVAQVDNTNGADNINMYSVVVVTEDGQQIEAMSPEITIGKWQAVFGTKDTQSYNQGVDLINANHFYLRPGAKGAAILIGIQPVPSVRRVFVYPAGGIDQIEATKVNR